MIKHKHSTHHAFNRVKSIQNRIKLNFISENDVDVMPELLLLVFFVIDVMIEAEAWSMLIQWHNRADQASRTTLD